MKTIKILICLIGCLLIGACNSNRSHNHHISITTKDSGNDLSFKADYPVNRTAAVQKYIEQSLKEERIFSSVSDVKKAEITLSDGSSFYLNYEPGFIAISFDRAKNSFAAYKQMKGMMAGFGKVIKD
jgi:hypothetical protein